MQSKVKSIASEPKTSDINVAWERTKKRLNKMNKDEIKQTFVDAGILTKKGNLTKPYRGVFVKVKPSARGATHLIQFTVGFKRNKPREAL